MANERPSRVDWDALERRIPLDELPDFHRAFLERVSPGEDWRQAFLRRVQGKVQASLKRLQREGRAELVDGALWIDRDLVPDAFLAHLEG